MNFLKKIYIYFKTLREDLPKYESFNSNKPDHPLDLLIPKNHPYNSYFRFLAERKIKYNFSDGRPPEGSIIFGIDSKNEMTILMELFYAEINKKDEKERPKVPFLMGQNPAGEVVWGDFASINHLLVSGVTGFGKSHLLNVIILSILHFTHPNEVKITVFDIKGLDFNCFKNLVKIIDNPEIFLQEIKLYTELIRLRNHKIKEAGCNNVYDYNKYLVSQNKPILPYEILVIDEYRLSQLDVVEFDLFVSKIASYGRASGIFLLISTQRASVDAINLHLRENIIHSVSFAQRTEGSSVIAGSKAAQKLTDKGKAVYSYISDREMRVPFFSQKYQQNAILNLENLRLPN